LKPGAARAISSMAATTETPLAPTASIKARLSLALLIVLVTLGLAIAAGANLLFERIQMRLTESDLSNATERLLAAIRPGSSGPQLDLSRLDAAYQRPLSGQYFVIAVDDQHWRSRSLWDHELQPPPGPGKFTHTPGPAGQQLLLLTRHYERFGQRFIITAAQDYSELVAEFRRGLVVFLALWATALVTTLVALNLWMGRVLRPLTRARDQVVAIQAGERQSLDTDAPEELAPLIHQINALLAETRRALTRSRQSLSNLGHALKTPLAVLSALVEREEIRQHPSLHRSLREQVEQTTRRIDRELGQSSGASAGGVQTPFAPARDLPPLAKALQRAHNRVLTVEWRWEGQPHLPVERDELLEVMGNLMDNAWKWASSRLRVSVSHDDRNWYLTVEDDGPGIPDYARRQQVTERGFRLDESVAGQGLGLAIAADITAAWRGELSLETSSLGGLLVRVSLPVTGSRLP